MQYRVAKNCKQRELAEPSKIQADWPNTEQIVVAMEKASFSLTFLIIINNTLLQLFTKIHLLTFITLKINEAYKVNPITKNPSMKFKSHKTSMKINCQHRVKGGNYQNVLITLN